MNIAIVGAGGMGRAWAVAVEQVSGAVVQAFVDPLIGSDAASPWLASFPNTLQVQSFESLLERDIDAVVVTALSPAHHKVVAGALAQGYHVIVEKPFVTRMADARALVELARTKNKTMMVSQNYRFFPGPQKVRDIVKRGEYGKIRAVVGQFWCDWPGKPYQHKMLHPTSLEMAIHHFDLARAMFEADSSSGQMREWNPRGSPYRMGGALEALFTMTSETNSFPFLYSGSLVSKAPRTPWGGLWRFEFDDATLVADVVDGHYGLFRATEAGYELLSPFGDDTMALTNSFKHFKTCLEAGREPWPSGKDNLETLKMALEYTDDHEPEGVADVQPSAGATS